MYTTDIIMKFEYLPNEIFMQCFQYLNATDIFTSFNQLNDRFNRLIRNVPLHFDFQLVQQRTFEQFCKMILYDANIQKRVWSLHLTKTITYDQIKVFVTLLSLDMFPILKSLSLNGLDKTTVQKVISALPCLSKLHNFSLMNNSCETTHLLVSLSASTVRTLSMQRLELSSFFSMIQLKNIVNLALEKYYIENMWMLLKYIPMLKSLRIQLLKQCDAFEAFDSSQIDKYVASHLRKLIIDYGMITFKFLEIFLMKTPNLNMLSLRIDNGYEFVDAKHWEGLIISFLPCLKTFNFLFKIHLTSDTNFIRKLQDFQNDFWHQQHPWQTSYDITNNIGRVYTRTYLSNSYTLWPGTTQHCIKYSDRHENVTDLSLYVERLNQRNEERFHNVKSLILSCRCSSRTHNCCDTTVNQVEHIKTMIPMKNLTHLTLLSSVSYGSSSLLLKLLKEAPNLSALKILGIHISSLLNDVGSHKYLNTMIKNLCISTWWKNSLHETKIFARLCQIFANIKQLKCDISNTDDISALFQELLTLRNLEVFVFRADCTAYENDWFQQRGVELRNYPFIVQCQYLNTDNRASLE